MKRIVGLLIIGALFSNSLVAQNQGRNQNPPPSKEKMEEMNKRVKSDLELSDSQAQQWDEIHQQLYNEMQEIRNNTALTKDEKREMKQKAKMSMDESLEAILTPEQMQKFREIQNDNRKKQQQNMAGMGKGEPRGGQRLNDLKGELSLNEEQTNQWDAITDQYRSKMRSLKQDESIDDAQRKDSMRELKDGMNKELLGILNPEQQKLFNEETEKQKNQMKQHQNGMNPSK